MSFRLGGLEADSAFLTRVLDSIEDAVAVVDRDFTILWANRAYRDSATPHEGRVEGARCYRVSHARDNPCGTREAGGEACDCPVAAAFAEGRPQRAAHVHQDADGRQIHVEVKAYPVRDAAGAVVAVLEVIRDITRQVELEAELRHAQKMEAVGVLVGGVAHDFNNVLTAITGYAELLQVELPAATPARLAADEILAAAERATRLTRSLLAFSHKVEAEFAVLEVNGVVLAVEKLLRRLVGEDVALELRLAEGPIHLHGDRYQLEQMLMNFATNARDAMGGGGGTLSVATEVVFLREEERRALGLAAAGGYCLLSVGDTGEGIPAEVRERVFEPFFTTKGPGRGTGLGLSMVARIVERHGGVVRVESRPGEGTTFRVYLPLVAVELAAGATAGAEVAELPGGSETILVAEDDDAVRALLVRLLEGQGYRVLPATDGREALRLCRQAEAPVDLYLLDVVMPRKGGGELYRELLRLHPQAQVLFVTGYPGEALAERGFPEGEVELLHKPLTRSRLLRRVREVLDRGVGAGGSRR